jgi:Flp pilus assembly protein TadG
MDRRGQLWTGTRRALRAFAAAFTRDRRGNISIIAALALPVLVGAMGLGFESSYWYMGKRSMQNAADAAAIAAASNSGANYDIEAKAVAAQYDLPAGLTSVSVTVANAPCPAGGGKCYGVTVTGLAPLFVSQVVGFQGDTQVKGVRYKRLTATAVAVQTTTPRQYCLLALAGSGAQGIRTNGAPKADMAGCNLMSNTTANCNGPDLGADIGDAHGANDGCGVSRNSNVPAVTDPYAGLVSNVPVNPCSAYPQAPAKKKDAILPASNLWAGTQSWSGNRTVCGDLQLTSDVVVNSASGAVLVIENGELDTNGHKLSTSDGSALTIVFSGTSGAYTHAPTGGGILDFTAPKSGVWSGVAIYQDPRLTEGLDISAAGNSPTWDITGLVYLPHASVTFSGAVNKSSKGKSCFGMVVDNILINGTGGILAHGECDQAGLTLPANTLPSRGKLVS